MSEARTSHLRPAVCTSCGQRTADLCPRALLLLILLLQLSAAGCVGRRGNVELLEARLRQNQDQLARHQRTLAETEAELTIARQEANLLREQMANAGASPLPAEYTSSLFQVEDIQFNTLMTGGRDQDGVPGDELLVVLFAPYDEHGELVKLPGRIELEAIDLSRTEEEGRRIANWVFDPEESRDLWRTAPFSRGFELRLVWPQPPEAEEILLHARLSTGDGRHFDASHTIAIVPLQEASAPSDFPTPEVIRPVSFQSESPPTDSRVDARQFPAWNDPVPSPEDISHMVDHESARQPRPDHKPVLTTDDAREIDPEDSEAQEPVPDTTTGSPDATSPPPGSSEQPRAFPDGLRTSDVWTDATIPRLR